MTRVWYAQCLTCRIDWPSYTEAGALILSDHHAAEFPGHECTVVRRERRDRGRGDVLVVLLAALVLAFVVFGVSAVLKTARDGVCAAVTCEEKP